MPIPAVIIWGSILMTTLSPQALQALTNVAAAAVNTSGSTNSDLQNVINDIESVSSPVAIKEVAKKLLGMGVPGVAMVAEKIMADCDVPDPVQRSLALQADFTALNALAKANASNASLLSRLFAAL